MTRPDLPRTRPRALVLLVCGIAASLASSACVTHESVEKVYDRSEVQVFAREYKRGFSVVEQDFEHPAHISAARLQHILGAIDIRGREEGENFGLRTVLEPDRALATALAISDAFEKVDANQVLSVRVTTKKLQHGIFNKKYLTTFVSWVKDDLLHFYFSRVDWEIPERTRKTELPVARVGDKDMRFRVVPFGRQAMYSEGAYALSVDWQDPVFRRPLRVAKETRGVRTILLEEEIPEARRTPPLPGDVLQHLSPADLRALADLEEARQNGDLTESQYRRKRKQILGDAARSSEDEGEQEGAD